MCPTALHVCRECGVAVDALRMGRFFFIANIASMEGLKISVSVWVDGQGREGFMGSKAEL